MDAIPSTFLYKGERVGGWHHFALPLFLSYGKGVSACHSVNLRKQDVCVSDGHSLCSSAISFTKGVSGCQSIHFHVQGECGGGWMCVIHFPCTPSLPSIFIYNGSAWVDGITLHSLSFSFVKGVNGCHSIHLHIQEE